MLNFSAHKSSCIKRFLILEVYFLGLYTKVCYLMQLKGFKTIIHFLMVKLYHN